MLFLDLKFEKNELVSRPLLSAGSREHRHGRASSRGSSRPRPPDGAPLVVTDPCEESGHLWDSSVPGNIYVWGPHAGDTDQCDIWVLGVRAPQNYLLGDP